MLNKLMARFKVRDMDTAKDVVRKHKNVLLVLIGSAILSAYAMIFGVDRVIVKAPPKKEDLKKVSVGELVDHQEVWAARMEAQAQKVGTLAQNMKVQNELQEKRLKSLEEALSLKTLELSRQKTQSDASLGQGTKVVGSSAFNPTSPEGGSAIGFSSYDTPAATGEGFFANATGSLSPEPLKAERKILNLTNGSMDTLKNAKHFVPAGTYARAVLTSSLNVSTAVSTQGNPEPLIIRLAEGGNLPRGWKSRMKDAVLIGNCYGDLSSERAVCRIHKLSFVEKDGMIVEKDVEGWVMGEDGAPGIRGKVVDKAGKVARGAFIAGILSGLGNFMKFEAQKGVFPVSPFGQSNAVKSEDALKGGLGTGVSNAFEKLADFTIKRAEAMQPVIVVNPGRFVDVVFKKGFDLRPFATDANLKVVSSTEQK